MNLNELINNIAPSKTVVLMARTKEMQSQDPDVLNFTGGEPDFATPEAICQEAYRQMMAGNTHYCDSKGDPELRARLAQKLQEENGIPARADNILVTPGAKLAIYLAMTAILNEGDEVLWLSPGWVSYPAIVTLCHGVPVEVHLNYDEDYRLTAKALEAKTTPKTKALVINYPNNPTGKIISQEELDELKNYLRKHPDVVVISDEIYEKVMYDGNVNLSLAADPEFYSRVITVNGFSKSSAMTGWRVGYLACDEEIFKAVLKVFQHSMSCTSSFIQKAAIVALDIPEETEAMRAAYERRRQIMYDGLNAIPGVEFKMPQGSFYAWVKFDTEMSSGEFCEKLLEETKVAGVPGEAYGEDDGCLIRFSFASAEEHLVELVRRLQAYLGGEAGNMEDAGTGENDRK